MRLADYDPLESRPREKLVPITFHLSEATRDRLNQMAEQERTGVASIVRSCLYRGLEQFDREEQKPVDIVVTP